MRTVRRGVVYRWKGYSPFTPELKEGTLLRVVNIPGGRRGGFFRNVEDLQGNLYFVNILNLAPRNAD
jgi:hypothetical protein